ncbi:MAG TPA: hypothetical protein PKI60_00230 [Oscillospiraceae bacterium]|nr:hypothetical protein [Oscillospiraceae bacterium]
MKKKLLFSAIAIFTFFTVGCKADGTAQISQAPETVSETESTEITTAVSDSKTVTICGEEYELDKKYDSIFMENATNDDIIAFSKLSGVSGLGIDGNGSTTLDLSPLADCKDLESLYLSGFKVNDVNFLEELKNLKWLSLNESDISDISALKKINWLTSLEIVTDNFSETEANDYFNTFKNCNISYTLDNSGWGLDEPTDGFVYYATTTVVQNPQYAPYSGQSTEFSAHFTNHTIAAATVDSVSFFYNDNDNWIPITFSQNKEKLSVGLTVEPNAEADFAVTKDQFDYNKAKAGRYKAVFTIDNKSSEKEFFINFINNIDSAPDFLTKEQQAVFDKAFEITKNYFGCSPELSEEYIAKHTADDLIAEIEAGYTHDEAVSQLKSYGYIDENGNLAPVSGGRGSDITAAGHCFAPVYSSDNEVMFKVVIIHYHGDNRYFLWYGEKSYHMVKTDDGWKFDKFPLWH